jgi:hypothetical protein
MGIFSFRKKNKKTEKASSNPSAYPVKATVERIAEEPPCAPKQNSEDVTYEYGEDYGIDQAVDDVSCADITDVKREENMRKQSRFTGTGGTTKTYSTWNYLRITDKKLTIILLENTQEAIDNKSTILKIIHRLNISDFVSVISYGSKVRVSEVSQVCEFDDEKFERKFEKFRINTIDIIGIGSGTDEGSEATLEEAVNCFSNILAKSGIETKYFCFAETMFVEPAAIGFHSIGAFPKSK